MSRNKKIFVSDAHIGASLEYDWLGAQGRKELASFLKALGLDSELEELVLVGDMLDNWVFPRLGDVPPTFGDILSAQDNQEVVGALKSLCARTDMKVTYVQGNHDLNAWGDLPAELRRALPGIRYEEAGVDRGPLWIEHGSRHAMFTAHDKKHDKKHGLPLGYFITRVNESGGRAAKASPSVGGVIRQTVRRHAVKYQPALTLPAVLAELPLAQTRKARKNFIMEQLAGRVFDVVLAKAKRKPDDTIMMPDGSKLVLGNVRDRYADLYADWVNDQGHSAGWEALIAEIDIMEPAAEKERKRRKKKAVLFGHSHDAKCGLLQLSYLNDGCFLKDTRLLKKKIPHFIEAVENDGRMEISLWTWESGSRKKRAMVKI